MPSMFALDFSDLPKRVSSTRDVRTTECRWPVDLTGEDDFTLCRSRVTQGAYCATHAPLAYRGPSRFALDLLPGRAKISGRVA